jgi:membrane-bound serine protease (ClpP class)
VLETQFTSHGLLTVAGIIALALGASALYTDAPLPSGSLARVAPAVIVITTGTVAVLMALVSYAAIRTRRMKAPVDIVGTPPPTGTAGTVQAPLHPVGTVFLGGETWSARTPHHLPLDRDTEVRLVGFDGLTAIVEPLEPDLPTRAPLSQAPTPADRT